MEVYKMALSNLFAWNSNQENQAGTACGASDKPSTACGSACGAGDKPQEPPTETTKSAAN